MSPNNATQVQFQPGVVCGPSLLLVLALLEEFFSAFFGFTQKQASVLQILIRPARLWGKKNYKESNSS